MLTEFWTNVTSTSGVRTFTRCYYQFHELKCTSKQYLFAFRYLQPVDGQRHRLYLPRMCSFDTHHTNVGQVTAYKNRTNYMLTFNRPRVTWCTTSLTFNNCTLCPHCIYVFCIYLRTNSDLCPLQKKKLIGFYNRDEKCLQRGTDWVFKYNGLCFVFKGII